jgi:hypothetical protein
MTLGRVRRECLPVYSGCISLIRKIHSREVVIFISRLTLIFLRRVLASFITALAMLSLPSCIEEHQEITLNPDGSGKVTIANTVRPTAELSPEERETAARQFLIELLRSRGVEAWTDVSYKVEPDGRLSAQATGYFSHLKGLTLTHAITDDPTPEFSTVEKDPEGNWVLIDDLDAHEEKKSEKDKAETPSDAPPQTETEITERLDTLQDQWTMLKPIVGEMLGDLKLTTKIKGGVIKSSTAFSQKDNHTAALEITGPRIMEGFSQRYTNRDAGRKLLKEGKDPTDIEGMEGRDFLEIVSGSRDMPKLILTPPSEPFFDYKEAVTKAKAEQTPELTALLAAAAKPDRELMIGRLQKLLAGPLGALGGSEPDADPPVTPEPDDRPQRTRERKPQRID